MEQKQQTLNCNGNCCRCSFQQQVSCCAQGMVFMRSMVITLTEEIHELSDSLKCFNEGKVINPYEVSYEEEVEEPIEEEKSQKGDGEEE